MAGSGACPMVVFWGTDLFHCHDQLDIFHPCSALAPFTQYPSDSS